MENNNLKLSASRDSVAGKMPLALGSKCQMSNKIMNNFLCVNIRSLRIVFLTQTLTTLKQKKIHAPSHPIPLAVCE